MLPSYETLYALNDREGVHALFSPLFDAVEAERFEEIDAYIAGLEIPRMTTSLMVCVLGATLTVASRIPGRQDFYDRVYARFVELGRDADKVLKGLSVDGERRAAEAWGQIKTLLPPKAPKS